jgi:hypothetical protein
VKAFKNGVLRRIFELTRGKMVQIWRTLHNNCFITCIIRYFNYNNHVRSIGWAENVAKMERRNRHKGI